MDGLCPEGVRYPRFGVAPNPGLAAFASSRTRLQRGFFTSAGHCSRTSAQEGWRLISDRLENFVASSKERGYSFRLCNMQLQEGYVYHINDGYFEKVQDDKLMQNKENGTYRPTFFCMRDEKHPFFGWFQ